MSNRPRNRVPDPPASIHEAIDRATSDPRIRAMEHMRVILRQYAADLGVCQGCLVLLESPDPVIREAARAFDLA